MTSREERARLSIKDQGSLGVWGQGPCLPSQLPQSISSQMQLMKEPQSKGHKVREMTLALVHRTSIFI